MSGPKIVPLKELPDKTRLVMRCAADIQPESIDWLWEHRLPLGKCVLLAGEGGLGKSMVLAWTAATVSGGKQWPCNEGRSRPGSVIILSAEDDAADTIVPRLMAAGADCSKIHILEAIRTEDDEGQRTFNLQLDLSELENVIEALDDVLLVIIDPITSYLGGVDDHKNAELRSVLEPLSKMASRQNVTVIANTHFSKASAASANNRIIGSVAFVNTARAAFIIAVDSEDSDRRLFIPSKANLGKKRDGLAYRIAEVSLPGPGDSVIQAPYVEWEAATVPMSADAAVAGTGNAGSALEEAKDFLRDLLSRGPLRQKEIRKEVDEAGLGWRTVLRAKDALGIESGRKGGIAAKGRWEWCLPEHSKGPTPELGRLSDIGQLSDPKVTKLPKVSNVEARRLSSDRVQGTESPNRSNSQARPTDVNAEGRREPEWPELPAFLDRRRPARL